MSTKIGAEEFYDELAANYFDSFINVNSSVDKREIIPIVFLTLEFT
ncbi:MAG: hypothetical protein AAFV71_25955 [Cyanobacteria bacterium J06633_8]